MVNPSGYTALDLIGYTDKGTYNAVATYVKNDLVHYNGSIWRVLIDDITGITPAEGTNYTIFVETPTDAVAESIAPTESAVSTHAYTIGKQLYYSNKLYKVIANIAVGDALIVGTNITESDKVTTQIQALTSNVATNAAAVAKCETLVVSVASFSALPQTITNANIDDDMVVVNSVLSNPSAQTGDWTVSTSNGSLTISGSISGTTTATLYLMKSR